MENVQFPADLGTKRKVRNKRERANKLLGSMGLEQFVKTRPVFLSGGQQQRVTISRALMNKQKIIFCDEPTGDLDVKTGKQIIDYICKINEEGITIVLVTHDQEVANRADRIIHMLDGKIVKNG